MEDSDNKLTYKTITKEELKKALDELTLEYSKQESRRIVMWQGCRKFGMIERSSFTRFSCDDPLCKTCREFDKALDSAMKEELKIYKFKDE